MKRRLIDRYSKQHMIDMLSEARYHRNKKLAIFSALLIDLFLLSLVYYAYFGGGLP